MDAYEAEKVDNPILHGIKNNRYVYIGPINIHVSRLAVESVVNECIKNKITWNSQAHPSSVLARLYYQLTAVT